METISAVKKQLYMQDDSSQVRKGRSQFRGNCNCKCNQTAALIITVTQEINSMTDNPRITEGWS